MSEEETIRLQKYLERCGVGSRRACGSLIETGAVAVDGKRDGVKGFSGAALIQITREIH